MTQPTDQLPEGARALTAGSAGFGGESVSVQRAPSVAPGPAAAPHAPTPLDAALHGLANGHGAGSHGHGAVLPTDLPPAPTGDAPTASQPTTAAPSHAPVTHSGPVALTPELGNSGGRKTYLLVDGENIDATLGMNVLGRRPNPEERPRWDRINAFARQVWQQPVVPLFFLNASNGQMPMPFIQALLAMGYRPIPLAGDATEKVVDIGIQRTLEAIKNRPGDVLLVSHDGDFAPQVAELLGGDRRVGLIAFREFVNAKFAELTTQGLDTFDLESDVRAFTTMLPRVRIIALDEFDPGMYL